MSDELSREPSLPYSHESYSEDGSLTASDGFMNSLQLGQSPQSFGVFGQEN
jgi:hypothetical protein